ncbi:uncharacterized protein LOC116340566 [Contarinia nasturtii]|uniref:uncharacterized protein LOC116340566 n=1 Tax=Contarinia nasturtii TaxID=265458 RepID=UPI0012D445BE|nr:uncharacterized protein LOC116340566 [Contarinia nasturtii]
MWVCESSLIETNIEDYISIVFTYYLKRHVNILTHFSCFTKPENVRVSSELSKQSIQSRFEVDFDQKIILDTPPNTIQGFVVHMKCDRFMDIFRDGDHALMFRDNNFWLFMDNNIDMNVSDALVQYSLTFNELNALPLSDLFIAKKIEYFPMRWILFDAYKIDYGNDIDIYPNGIIETSANGTLMLSGLNELARRRQNLKGLSIPCGLVIAYPEKFTYVDDPQTNHIDTFTKAYVKLGENLREDLNMSCQVLQVDSYGWINNGTKMEFDGIMGLFQRKQIRIATHGINMRPERLMFSDFTGSLFTPRTPLIFRQPPLTTVANIYTLPFELDVWRSIVAMIVLVTIVMLLQILHSSLRTTITSLDVSPSNYIKTLDDLIASPMKAGIHEAGYARFYVKSNYSGIHELYEKKVEPLGSAGWIYDPFVGIERVRSELFAFQVDSQSAYKAIHKTYTETEKCSTKELQIIVLPLSTIPVEKNCGYKELMRQRITWQKDVGLMNREKMRWIPKKPQCLPGHGGFIMVDLNDIEVNEYIKVVSTYYRVRNINILTHCTCFSPSDNAKISIELSKLSIQSRFLRSFDANSQLIDTPIQTVQGFIVNKYCDHIKMILLRDDHGVIFKNNNLWLFIDNDAGLSTDDSLAEYKLVFDQFNAMPISDVFIIKRHQNDKIQWKMFDAYKLNYGYDSEVMENGYVIEFGPANEDLMIVEMNFSSARRQNLKGVNVTCGLVITKPEKFTSVDDFTTDHIDVFTKASVNVGKLLFDLLNISCHVRQTDSYGSPNMEDGVIGLFQKKQIQMTVHGINMHPEQLKHVEFAGDIFTPRTPLLFRQPPLHSMANIFLLPLEIDVWICILTMLFIIFIVMSLQLMHPILKSMSITSFDVATFILGALCQQGTHLSIPTASGRFVVMTTFLATLALFTSYSATIVAILQNPTNFIKNLDNLIKSPLKVGMYQTDYTRSIVDSNYSGVMEVYVKKVLPEGANGWINDSFVGIEKVRSELFGFQVDSPSAYKAILSTFTQSEICSLTEIQMIVLPISTILVERNSGYKELIRQKVKWQKEIGLMKRDELRWIPKKPNCEGGRRDFVSVGLSEIKPAIIMLLMAYVISAFLSIIEVIFHQLQTQCKQSKKKSQI